MSTKTLVVGLLCLLPLVGLTAEPQKDRPGKPEAKADVRPVPDGLRDSRNALRQHLRDFNPSEKQIEDAEAFYKEHSPNFFKAYRLQKEEALKRNPKSRFLQKWLTHNHVEIKAVESADPELFAMKLQQLKIEDKIMGVVAQARQAGTLNQQEIRSDLRADVQELLNSRKQEAEHRVKRLEAMLGAERQRLAEMNDHGPEWVNAKMEEEINRLGRFSPPVDVPGPTTAED